MKRKILLISVLLIFASSFFAHENSESVKFEFKYQKGDRYRILSTVDEDIFVNHRKSHHSIIVNRVSAEITDVTKDGQGIHDCIFMTTEDSTGTFTGARFSYGKD